MLIAVCGALDAIGILLPPAPKQTWRFRPGITHCIQEK